MPVAEAVTAAASSSRRAARTSGVVTREAPTSGTSWLMARVRTRVPFWASWTASLLEYPATASTLPEARAACWV